MKPGDFAGREEGDGVESVLSTLAVRLCLFTTAEMRAEPHLILAQKTLILSTNTG